MEKDWTEFSGSREPGQVSRMPITYTKKQTVALSLVAACAVGIILASFYLVRQLSAANWWVTHTLQVMRESDEALLCLIDCETAYRGYLASNDTTFLEPWKSCEGHVFAHIERLAQLTADNQKQHDLVPQLAKLAHEKVDFGRRAILAREKNSNALARNLVNLLEGKRIMDEFRHLTHQMRAEEENLYAERERNVKQLESAILASVGLLSLLMAGALFWIRYSTNRFAREQNQAREIVVSARDSAIRANELKSQFVANVSHEIRTPLSGVLGMSELLSRTDLDADKKEMVGHIHRSAQNLLAIVNDLLDFSKLDAGKIVLVKDDFVIKTIIKDVTRSIELSAAGKNIDVHVDLDPQVVDQVYIGDGARLRQVLLNLVHNAVKFTEKGTIWVSVAQDRRTGNSATLQFVVKDTGIGMTPDVMAKLFQPFVQADGSTTRRYGGTGLGLSICKKIVELMSGTIRCESEGTGNGSKFIVDIPFEVTARSTTKQEDRVT